MSFAHLRPLTAGEILDGAFVLYRRHFGVLVAASAVATLPLLAYWAAVVVAGAVPEELPRLLTLYDRLATVLVWGALAALCSAAVTGEPVSLRAAYGRARDCFWRLFGVSFLSGLAAVAAFFVLVVPGIAVFLLLFLSSHAVVVEGKGVSASLERSWTMSRPHWRRVAGVLGVTAVIFLLPFVMALGTVELAGDEAAWLVGVSGLLENLLYLLVYPYAAAAATLLYYDCRVRGEALDLQAAAADLPVPA